MSNKNTSQKKVVLPGDFIAYPEEFLPGKNAYEEGDSVRARLTGVVERDLSKREVAVKTTTKSRALKVGDVVVGQVEAAMTSTAGVRITWVNGIEMQAGIPGTIFTRGERSGRGERRTYVKLADVVRARVASMLNGMNQLSIDEPHMGVLAGLCTICGAPLPRGDSSRTRCENCGNVEERKFADDFGAPNIQP